MSALEEKMEALQEKVQKLEKAGKEVHKDLKKEIKGILGPNVKAIESLTAKKYTTLYTVYNKVASLTSALQ